MTDTQPVSRSYIGVSEFTTEDPGYSQHVLRKYDRLSVSTTTGEIHNYEQWMFYPEDKMVKPYGGVHEYTVDDLGVLRIIHRTADDYGVVMIYAPGGWLSVRGPARVSSAAPAAEDE